MSLRIAMATVAFLVLVAGKVGGQSLEEETRRPPGTNSLHDDSQRLKGNDADESATDSLDNDSEGETRRPRGRRSLDDDSQRLKGNDADEPATDSLDNDSMELRGRTVDQDGTNSLDDGWLHRGDDPDTD